MGNQINECEVLNALSIIIPYLPILFSEDVAIGITDTKKYLKVQMGRQLDLRVEVGASIPEGGAALTAMRTGETIIKDVPKEIFGIPFKSYAIPMKQGNEIVGAFVVGKSLEIRNSVVETVTNLSGALKQISVAISEFGENLQHVDVMSEMLLDNAKESQKSTHDTNEILKFIQGIASRTNLLGLNASIEAARAGESGKGFAVVASEIRNLSLSTSESVKKIDLVLKTLESSINNITGKIVESNDVQQSQSATIEEILASIQELTATAESLEELSGVL
ncbi:MAG: methyl-accepting chemotaxis protein [Velocimicrobium sp.]